MIRGVLTRSAFLGSLGLFLASGLPFASSAVAEEDGDKSRDPAVKIFKGRDYPDFWRAKRDLSGRAGPATSLRLREGFRAELLYTVPIRSQGSWVSLATDPRGRLIASAETGGLFLVTPPPLGGPASETKVEALDVIVDGVTIRGAQGLLQAFDSLYLVINSGHRAIPGLYRIRDTDGDDRFDDARLLRRLGGRGEHGPHAIVAGPDGKYLYLIAGNGTRTPSPERSLDASRRGDDRLLFSSAVAKAHGDSAPIAGAFGKTNPGGWVCRTDPEGESFELVASGFRNAYDLAFHPDGELFTYDSDNEGEIGTPWYRPTRVNHVVSGGEYGWRMMTAKWPSDYLDSCGSVVDVGRGSPTGAVFGTHAKFPARYQRSLFVGDWSFGNLYAVHLEPDGASYRGTCEPFISGAPLPIADVVIHPTDGAMYFVVGGRRVTSALYRVTYVGDESTAPARAKPDASAVAARAERRRLETLHGRRAPGAVEMAWKSLSHSDRSIRYAARVALEGQPVSAWQDRALAETRPRALIASIVSLARSGRKSLQVKMAGALGRIGWSALSPGDRLDLARAYALVLCRTGDVHDETRATIIDRLSARFPSGDSRLDRELAEILIHVRAPDMTARALDRLEVAKTQEEEIHYAVCLLALREGWSLEETTRYFRWLDRASQHRGGVSLGYLLYRLRKVAASGLSLEEKKTLGDLLREKPPTNPRRELEKRKLVKKWSQEELVALVEAGGSDRNLERGRSVFSEALCYRCHRLGGAGGTGGPDLTGVGNRFGTRELVEAIVAPSRVISDQYRLATVVLDDGRVLTGKIADVSGDSILFINDSLNMVMSTIDRSRVVSSVPSDVSMMPAGLLDRFAADEIQDMVAFLKSRGGAVPAGKGK